MTILIVPMAGRGQRFIEAGFTTPKFLLPVGDGLSLLTKAVASLGDALPELDVRFVWSSATQAPSVVIPAISETVEHLGLNRASVVELACETSGQADTAFRGLSGRDSDTGLLIWNVDTFIDPAALDASDVLGSRSAVYCFHEERDLPYSWVAVDGQGRAKRVAEKHKISNFASVGLYQWRDSGTFMDAVVGKRVIEYAESYVAPLYNVEIAAGVPVHVPVLPRSSVTILGTPEEYYSWRRLQ